ncbi:SCO family protein [uncultured Halopseudomonas sp.]|uniref:SCO family protein n=1 Tax=uncultured Halopseudomonas sp. TaxID=2901193 RepID=UPI0030ED4D69|tara:strand:+ start:27964 stop:28593 length:630 start_codon:yes stop_codon:yes gene_type:complete
MSGVQKTVLVTVAAIALVLGAVVAKVNRQAPLDREVLSNSGIFLFDNPRNLPDVELQAATGDTWGNQDLAGQWDLLFFGYTFCPDICPTTMADLRSVVESLPSGAREQLRVTMVSVDPERDTPQQLTEYLAYFKSGFKGVTGEPPELAKLAQALSVAYIPPDTSEENYLVDHSGQVVMVNPQGQYVGFIRPPFKIAELSLWLPRIMNPQ